MSVRAGEWVEVRSKEEILATLDANGRLEGMPFMPQMFEWCGKRVRVYRSGHKTCDTVNPIRSRTVPGGVHLENVRCDGAAYGGCDAACLIFWKEAWLKPVGGEPADAPASRPSCTEAAVTAATKIEEDGETLYRCQATELPKYTGPLEWWDARQYVQDFTSGNSGLVEIVRGLTWTMFNFFTRAYKPKWGRPFRGFYDSMRWLWGGIPYPRRAGRIPKGKPTPMAKLDLKPGEYVRVKPFWEILETIDTASKNRGMDWGEELAPFCGNVYRVRSRVVNFLDEKTGKMLRMKTPAVILEDVWCRSRYSQVRLFCPRAIYPWWREIWLERVEAPADALREPTQAAKLSAPAQAS